ncbi:MAG: formimidoylglutamase [Gemmataceae bacterium]|nr:formimidoylglutamase [Gemmataceae bacterium]
MSVWSGRNDVPTEGPDAGRWHQHVQFLSPGCEPGTVILGFCCDEGVIRNQGRPGASAGPDDLRRSLANLAWHQTGPAYDAGNVRCRDGDLESAQVQLSEAVADAITSGHHPIILGGGHETAWGTYLGVAAAHPGKQIGIINIDAHFDLRSSPQPHSGTPFAQMAAHGTAAGRPFRYLCLGVAEPANTPALFARAHDLGTVWNTDLEILHMSRADLIRVVDEFAAACDVLYLSLDLDVLESAVMPAVSAPAIRGLPLATVLAILDAVTAQPKLAAADVVEFNPSFDQDRRGARVAAGLVWHIARNWRAAPGFTA